MNNVVDVAKKLNIRFRCSMFGISILGKYETKFFRLTPEELEDAVKFIKEEADANLQTTLDGF